MRKMIDSGVEWLGDIPETWDLVQLGSLFSEHKNKNTGMQSNNLLSLSYGNIIRKDINTSDGLLPESFEGYNVIDDGDIVLRLTDLQNDQRSLRVGLCHEKGIVTSAYVTLRKRNSAMNSQFFYYLIHSYDVRKGFYGMGAGVRQGLNYAGVRKIMLTLPPANEQIAVADLLDEKITQVDTLIANVQAQIEKLKAYKQSLITEVVTKGLDPNVPMKDSGVENLGQIPTHWKVLKLKYIAKSFSKGSGITKEEIVEDGDTPCVRYGEIYTKYNFHFSTCATRTNKDLLSNPQYFSHGDLLFTTTGELVEEIGKSIVYLGEEDCLAGGDVVIMKHSQHPMFMGFALGSYYAQEQKSRGKAKLKVVHTSANALGNIYIVLPPIDEQIEIAEHLEKCHAQIDRLITIKQAKIEKLEQYKKSLIYEYVTGKKQVEVAL